jgi:hypothetical protein
MWKVVLVLFMTSNTQPVSTMVGQFPESFACKAACLEFISNRDGEIDGTVQVFTKYAEPGFKVLNHNLHCIEDTGGEPV